MAAAACAFPQLVVVALAAAGRFSLWAAVLVDALTAIAVILNGMCVSAASSGESGGGKAGGCGHACASNSCGVAAAPGQGEQCGSGCSHTHERAHEAPCGGRHSHAGGHAHAHGHGHRHGCGSGGGCCGVSEGGADAAERGEAGCCQPASQPAAAAAKGECELAVACASQRCGHSHSHSHGHCHGHDSVNSECSHGHSHGSDSATYECDHSHGGEDDRQGLLTAKERAALVDSAQ